MPLAVPATDERCLRTCKGPQSATNNFIILKNYPKNDRNNGSSKLAWARILIKSMDCVANF